ncbi:hypothetical protein J6590_057677, partial [Homalodisca vitripennis]
MGGAGKKINEFAKLWLRSTLKKRKKLLSWKSHSSIANLNPLPALESVIELGGLPVKRQKLVNA